MEAMSRIQSTQRRIANLDWRRDTHRAGEVALDVPEPTTTGQNRTTNPSTLIRYLADRDVEDEYTYLLLLPEQRPILLPREQSLIRKIPAKTQPQSYS